MACEWHEHHARTISEIERREHDGQQLVIATHSLFEAYSVLTRLPFPHRVPAGTARTLLEANWKAVPGVHLTTEETWRTLRKAEKLGVSGGSVYDALISACAIKAGVSTLLTWNLRHFGWLGNGMEVTEPE